MNFHNSKVLKSQYLRSNARLAKTRRGEGKVRGSLLSNISWADAASYAPPTYRITGVIVDLTSPQYRTCSVCESA